MKGDNPELQIGKKKQTNYKQVKKNKQQPVKK